ncbi:MAG TPA: methyltransferase domain-containing protein [Opitutaceae bacterium]|nr:methyltransferase domain-containing protein [Opitutaceae bacterium]
MQTPNTPYDSPATAVKVLTEYLDTWKSHPGRLATHEPDQPRVVKIGGRITPRRFKFAARLYATNALRVRERRRAVELAKRRPLLLHPGCQKIRKEGWVNIDLAGFPVELNWNLLRPLPFPDDCADAVFHEHLQEHFSLVEGLGLTREFCRVLKPGGILRIGVPDAGRYLRGYVDESSAFLETIRPGRPTRLLAIQDLFYWPGHRTMYDFETLRLVVAAAGFARVEQRAFGESALDPVPDSAHRELETLYVEAVK